VSLVRSAWCWSARCSPRSSGCWCSSGVVEPGSTKTLLWIVLVAVGIVLGVGLSWSKVRQRATGQVEAD